MPPTSDKHMAGRASASAPMMMLLLLTVTIPTVTATTASNQNATISFQIHSYNDLRLWPQMFAKTGYWIKIDPHYMGPEFCETQHAVKNASSGCFVLNHDRPVPGVRQYNTTDQVLDLLAQPSMQNMLAGKHVAVALCFKWDEAESVCGNSTVALRWLSLVDDFYRRAQDLIQSIKTFTLEFIMDGEATPSGRQCLADRWRPWNSTWISSRDPSDALDSNNASAGYDRFQINNMPSSGSNGTDQLIKLQSKRYGKFLDGVYPFLFWEPSDQKTIQRVAHTYELGPVNEPQGFRFAINIDPYQLLVYAASTTAEVAQVNHEAAEKMSRPESFDVQTLTTREVTYRMAVATETPSASASPITTESSILFRNSSNGLFVYMRSEGQRFDLYGVEPGSGRLSWSEASPEPSSPATSRRERLASPTERYFLLSNTSGHLWLFDGRNLAVAPSQAQTPQLGTVSSTVVAPSPSLVVSVSASIDNNMSQLCLAATTITPPALISSDLTAKGGNMNRQTRPKCTSLPKDFKINADSLRVAAAVNSSRQGEVVGVVTLSGSNNAETDTVMTGSDPHIFYMTFTMSLHDFEFTLTSTLVDAAIGTSASVDVTSTGFVAMLIADGYCWNGEPQNKRPFPASCDQTPKSVNGVMQYVFSTLKALQRNEGHLRPCDDVPRSPEWLVGSIGFGNQPSVAISSSNEKHNRVIAVFTDSSSGEGSLDEEEGINGLQASFQPSWCGYASFNRPGIYETTFPVLPWT